MRQALMLSAAAIVLAACGGGEEATPDDAAGTDTAATTETETAGGEGAEGETVEASFAGDCVGAEGESPVINAVDRDEWGDFGIDLEAMDTRFEPGDDFFCYVNGARHLKIRVPSAVDRKSVV